MDEAGKTMEEIVTSVKRVTDIMAEITAACQEQSTGIACESGDYGDGQVTQQNAALVEQAAAAAGSMQDQAAVLAELVSRFTLSPGNGAVRVTAVAPSATRVVARKPLRSLAA